MIEGEVRRRVLTPFWCEQHPMKWTTSADIGLAHFAHDGKVGLFNISWWLVGHRKPPAEQVYRSTNILWAIMVGEVAQLRLGETITDCAAMMTCREWEALMRLRLPSMRRQLCRHGMQYEHLQQLLYRRKEFA